MSCASDSGPLEDVERLRSSEMLRCFVTLPALSSESLMNRTPPARTGPTPPIAAKSVLVLAPHADDESLGCGGLLVQLARSGARVRVLYLTDSAGFPNPSPERSAVRKEEARQALVQLGVEETPRWLDLPDGRLIEFVAEAAHAIEQALFELQPELLLCPAPSERSSDHRAAFQALHRALRRLRPGTELARAVYGLRILLYEINQPLPEVDLLVDISEVLPVVERALACHASELARHPYARAGLALRRYRTLSLPAAAEAAEAYRLLPAEAFVLQGAESLAVSLGGTLEGHAREDGPRVSIVVRTRNRPQLLAEALESLARNSYRDLEVVLVNDGGVPPLLHRDYPFSLVQVDLPEQRGRAAAANAGLERVTGDRVGFLDDDDLVAPDHLAQLVAFAQARGAAVVYSDAATAIYEPDAERGWRRVERRIAYSGDFDRDRLALDNYIPFHTISVDRKLLERVGPLDPTLEVFEDWDLLLRLAAHTDFHHLPEVTCEYRIFRGGDQAFGESPRNRPDFLETRARILAKHPLPYERLARGVAAIAAEGALLRTELFNCQRQLDSTRQELERAVAEQTAVIHKLYGELERLYAEVDRLNQLIRDMQNTRAWRLHQTWERWKRRL